MVIRVVRALRMSTDIRHSRVRYFVLLLDDIGLHAANATSSTNLWLITLTTLRINKRVDNVIRFLGVRVNDVVLYPNNHNNLNHNNHYDQK
jgi:hypothetical protein